MEMMTGSFATGMMKTKERAHTPISFEEFVSYFTFGGVGYPFPIHQTLKGKQLDAPGDFIGYVNQVYKTDGVVFACELARMMLFSEGRFIFRKLQDGRPGELYGNESLGLLRRPWSGGTTGDLLTRCIQDADLQGDSFTYRRPRRLTRLRPDWVTVMYGSASDGDMWELDAELVGYLYHPGGLYSNRDPVPLLPENVAHFMPIPDPLSPGRGMSWLTPVLREILGDMAATQHKLQFFENGATPNLAVSLEITDPDKFKKWIEIFEDQHKGVANAYKTLYLGGAAKTVPVGMNFEQMDFKIVQGHGETRIAAAAGVPPVIVGLSEGLQAATYSNYGQARRRFADGTMWPLWRNLCGSMARIIPVPWDSELWIDDRDIPFLREDQKDAAEIQHTQAQSIKQLVEAGFDENSVIDAITSGDLKRLKHTGLLSVQLQKPGTTNGKAKEGQPALAPGTG